MERIAMTDGSGRWFNLESAEEFSEETSWNGNNHISKATGSQWHHEDLYRTASGKWVLHRWSQMTGEMESWEIISDDEAAVWLVTNNHDSDIVKKQIEELEL